MSCSPGGSTNGSDFEPRYMVGLYISARCANRLKHEMGEMFASVAVVVSLRRCCALAGCSAFESIDALLAVLAIRFSSPIREH